MGPAVLNLPKGKGDLLIRASIAWHGIRPPRGSGYPKIARQLNPFPGQDQ